MSLWTMPAVVSAALDQLAAVLDRRTRERFWSVFFGLLLCREKRRTASAWFRAAGIGHDFRRAYHVLGPVGNRPSDGSAPYHRRKRATSSRL